MNMCYDGTLVMPSSYAMMGEDEMSYVEGGGSSVVYGTANNIRSRLTTVIGSSLAGTGGAAALAALGGPLGAVAAAVIGGGWYNSYRSAASKAHSSVEKIIKKYGKSRRCKMTTTYSFAYYCTGITVKTA